MKESRLFSFIDQQSAFTVHFLHAEKLINDIMRIHNIGPTAFKFYQETLLSSAQMLNFMKATENMGFYIDSQEPYFRFKIELNAQGTMRTLLLPEEFDAFPDTVTGKARVTKAFPNNAPYSSVIELQNESVFNITNRVLQQSYQTKTHIETNPLNFGLMFSKLPPSSLAKKFDEIIDLPLQDFVDKNSNLAKDIEQLVSKAQKGLSEKEIVSFFTEKSFVYLGSKEVKFFCPCSKERMSANMLTLANSDLDEIFRDKDSVEVRCDYCNSIYDISKDQLHQQ